MRLDARLHRLVTIAAALLGASCAAAQEVSESQLTHWAYAATFGTGVYELADGTESLVVRAPLSWAWRKPDPTKRCKCGVRFLFPVTIGVQNFNLDDILAGGFPDRIEQASFLPGVEVELPRSERWTLRLRAQVGWGTELGGARESALIYTAGVRSRLVWPDARLQPAWITGLQWAGYDPEQGARGSQAKLTNGVELDVPVPRWQFHGEAMHLMPHVLNDWYFDTVDFFSVVDESVEPLATEWEVGLAARRDQPFSIFRFKFDRVGIAYRFSEDSRGIRLMFSSIF